MHRPACLTVVLAVLALTAACAAGGGVGAARPEANTPVPTMTAAALTTTVTSAGTVVTDGNGRTLYMFTADVPASRSACGPACLMQWPALDAPAAHAGEGIDLILIGTITRQDGREQITYAQHPLYYSASDDAVGEVKGHGEREYGGFWLMLRPDGTPVQQ
jgi:predicted lipoprotein with Yx(FWY)xxD motif